MSGKYERLKVPMAILRRDTAKDRIATPPLGSLTDDVCGAGLDVLDDDVSTTEGEDGAGRVRLQGGRYRNADGERIQLIYEALIVGRVVFGSRPEFIAAKPKHVVQVQSQ